MAITNLGQVLAQRISALPNRGLDALRAYLRTTGSNLNVISVTGVSPAENLSVFMSDFSYSTPVVTPQTAVTSHQTLHNHSPARVTTDFTYEYDDENQFEFSFTEGLTVGIKVSAKVGTPAFGSIGAEFSAQFDFTAEQSWTYNHSTHKTATVEIELPPESSASATATITTATSTAAFTATALTLEGTVRMPYLALPFTQSGVIVVPITALLTPAQRTVSVAGTIEGAQFVDDNVDVVPSPEPGQLSGKPEDLPRIIVPGME
jgi:hypothetical protein